MNTSPSLFKDVLKFNKEIIGMEPPMKLQLLNDEKLNWAVNAFREEVQEFHNAHLEEDLPGAVDALIDLMYFVLGRMVEIGMTEQQVIHCWNTVHAANMKKKKGNKGRGSEEDAIKPEGWEPPKFDFTSGDFSPNCPVQIEPPIFDLFAPLGDFSAKVEAQYKEQEKIMLRGIVTNQPQPTFTMADIPVPFQESAELRKKKGEDYRSGGVEMKDYFPFGMQSYFTMINTKVLRLKSLLTSGKDPNNESIRDTLLDLMNYACFNIEAIDKGEV